MKKIAMLLLAVLLIAVLAIPASAAGAASLVVGNTTVYRGNKFTVTVYVSNLDSCRTGGIEVSYGSGLELVEGEWLMSDTALKNFSTSSKDGVFALNSAARLSGNIFRMTFKVKSNAAFESNSISVKLLINNQQVELEKALSIKVACNHKYSEWKSVGQSGHSRSCSICGTKDSGSHVFDHDCDTECNDCGETRETSHVFEEVWVGDETGHWHECVNCKEKTELEAHVPGPEAGEYTDQVCTVCNFVIVPALGHQHRYDTTYQQDEHMHWQLCLGCGEATEQEAHIYDSSCDELCNTCNYQRPVRHNVGEDWDYDENRHWKECEDCHSKLEDGNHIWNGGTVTVQPQLNKDGKIVYTCGVCQQERTGTVPALTFFEVVPWWGWLAIGFGAGTILVVAVGWIVIASKSKSNSKGRFSN